MTKIIRNNYKKILFLLVIILLFGCEEEQQASSECDAVCELLKADFERFTTKVNYGISSMYDRLNINVTKTATGAKAIYNGSVYGIGEPNKKLEAELSLDEWQDFIGALFKCNTNEWEKEYDEQPSIHSARSRGYGGGWSLSIYSSNKEYPKTYRGYKIYPPNFEGFKKVIDDMRHKIMDKAKAPLEAKLKAEYVKRFTDSISYFELSTELVFLRYGYPMNPSLRLVVSRTETGATAKYVPDKEEIKLNIDEWLDFVRALHKLHINEWEKKYGESLGSKNTWILEIYPSDELIPNEFEFYDAYPQNWDEFIKIVDNMEKKIKEKTGNR